MADRVKEVAAILSTYNPSLRDRIGDKTYEIAKYLGLESIDRNLPYRMRRDIESAVDFIPFIGDAVSLDESVTDLQAGNYLDAAGGFGATAVGLLPGAGDVASKALKSLPSSASLNIPVAPTVEQLNQFAKLQPVPLDMARGSQPKMDWESFNSGNYAVPMFEGYTNAPVAALRRDGEYIIFDGHHRTVNALNQGQTELPMYVIDSSVYDPMNAGRVPSSQTIDDDALLRELGL